MSEDAYTGVMLLYIREQDGGGYVYDEGCSSEEIDHNFHGLNYVLSNYFHNSFITVNNYWAS